MSVIRAFIAIDISEEIRSHLERIETDLIQMVSNQAVRWVPVANIHLTLKFLGDVSLNNLDLLKDALHTEVVGHHRFNISVGGIGAFPKIRNPRVVWVGVEGPESLVTLQRGIENQMARLGYERDQRNFSAHLTLGRVSRSARPEDIRSVSNALDKYKVGFIGITPVNEVQLIRSDLHSDGAVYTSLMSVTLSE
jgi:2'-5' RNA ligase